jgi:hypothetical protein
MSRPSVISLRFMFQSMLSAFKGSRVSESTIVITDEATDALEADSAEAAEASSDVELAEDAVVTVDTDRLWGSRLERRS